MCVQILVNSAWLVFWNGRDDINGRGRTIDAQQWMEYGRGYVARTTED